MLPGALRAIEDAKARKAEAPKTATEQPQCQGETALATCPMTYCKNLHQFTVCMYDASGGCNDKSCNYWHGVTEVRTLMEVVGVGPRLETYDCSVADFTGKCKARVRNALSDHLRRLCSAINKARPLCPSDGVYDECKFLAQQYNGVISTLNFSGCGNMSLFYRCARRLSNPLPLLAACDQVVKLCQTSKRFFLLDSSTGSGKSTQMPQYLAECAAHEAAIGGRGGQKLVICVEPRSVAAHTLAQRVATEYIVPDAKPVGCWTGSVSTFHRQQLHILYTTEHALLRLFQADMLDFTSDVYAVILDEAHERSVVGDMLLGLMKEKVFTTAAFRLIVCSATLQTDVFNTYLPDACLISVSSRRHPIDVFYHPVQVDMNPERDYVQHTVDAVVSVVEDVPMLEGSTRNLTASHQPHILAFLPSADDVEAALDALNEYVASKDRSKCDSDGDRAEDGEDEEAEHLEATSEAWKNVDRLCISGRLNAEEQQQAFEAKEGVRKVLFATSVAETSVTIDGVGIVIDSGFARTLVFDPVARATRLEISPVTKSAACQRAGRAGRTGPGICIRLYSQTSFNLLADNKPAALRTSPLHLAALQLADLGRSMETFDWVEKPPIESVNETMDELQGHGALEHVAGQGGQPRLTSFGQFLLKTEQLSVPVGKLMFDAYHQQGMKDHFLAVAALVAAIALRGHTLFYCSRNQSTALHEKLRRRGEELDALENGDLICIALLIAQTKSQQTQPRSDATASSDDPAANCFHPRGVNAIYSTQRTLFRGALDALDVDQSDGDADVTEVAVREHAPTLKLLIANSFFLQVIMRRGDRRRDYQTVGTTQMDCRITSRSFVQQQCVDGALGPGGGDDRGRSARAKLWFNPSRLPSLCVYARMVSYCQAVPT